MDLTVKILFVYCLVFLFVFGEVLNGNIVQVEKSCALNVTEGRILAMKESKMEANASVFASLNVTSNTLCRESCCMEKMCSIYMFLEDTTYQKKLHANCFLVHCDPIQKCKYRDLSGCEIGSKAAQTPPESAQTQLLSTAAPTPEVSVVTTHVATSFPYSEAAQPSVVSAVTQSTSDVLNNSIPVISQSPAVPQLSTTTVLSMEQVADSAVNTAVPTTPQSASQETNTENPATGIKPKETFHFVGSNNISDFDSKHSHTNTASLVIALIFGIVFLAASVALLGRRWWESFRRRRAFSKVDYLLNGV